MLPGLNGAGDYEWHNGPNHGSSCGIHKDKSGPTGSGCVGECFHFSSDSAVAGLFVHNCFSPLAWKRGSLPLNIIKPRKGRERCLAERRQSCCEPIRKPLRNGTGPLAKVSEASEVGSDLTYTERAMNGLFLSPCSGPWRYPLTGKSVLPSYCQATDGKIRG